MMIKLIIPGIIIMKHDSSRDDFHSDNSLLNNIPIGTTGKCKLNKEMQCT